MSSQAIQFSVSINDGEPQPADIAQLLFGRALTPILDDLEKRGLITRERLPSNQRSYSLNLTSAGVALRDELMEHARTHEDELSQIVGLGRKSDLINTLRRITTELP